MVCPALGREPRKERNGLNPVRALGAIDQHSQIQLYTEGPDDKLFTVMTVADPSEEITIPETEEKPWCPFPTSSASP